MNTDEGSISSKQAENSTARQFENSDQQSWACPQIFSGFERGSNSGESLAGEIETVRSLVADLRHNIDMLCREMEGQP